MLFHSCCCNRISLWPRTVAPQKGLGGRRLVGGLVSKEEGREGLCRIVQAPQQSQGAGTPHCWLPQDTPGDRGLWQLLVPVATLRPVVPSLRTCCATEPGPGCHGD